MNEAPSGIEEDGAGAGRGILQGLRVLEVADEQAEYCGMLLAGLGADVIKVEPPGGSSTRQIGPFYQDQQGPESSLFFWQYNRGKRSIVLDPHGQDDRKTFRAVLGAVDILIDSSPGGALQQFELDPDRVLQQLPRLIMARMTPFGDRGPWSHFQGSDLVHLALGGVVMNCGYDPEPGSRYDLPPVAPQMWHAYHIAGEQLVMAITAALIYRWRTGRGQVIECSVHEAVSKCTEVDLMTWVMRRATVLRQTCRHARETVSKLPSINYTKDGRWVLVHLGTVPDEGQKLVSFLEGYDAAADLQKDTASAQIGARSVPGTGHDNEELSHTMEVIQRLIRAYAYDRVPWRQAQEAGLLWSPLRKPHENAIDPHWLERKTYSDIEHPELGRSFRYPVSKNVSTVPFWTAGRRAPLLNEDAQWIRQTIGRAPAASKMGSQQDPPATFSSRGKPFALKDVRILDFGWFLASAGGTRFLAAYGAECLKVEMKTHPDTRLAAMAPVGGRAARQNATAPLPGVTDPDMGGQFNNKNAGKRGISLNVRHPKGLAIAKRLVAICDVVAEGFSPGVMDRWGLGYEVLKSIRPDIIYAQQSGMGAKGRYGRLRAVGPIANSFTGLSEMSGLPEPAMPAGWGYSYLDWMGAYAFAQAILLAMYHRERTGEGQWIDASQCEAGLFLTGVPVLDWSANGRVWKRYGNRSPYKPAAPHGIYPSKGEDRWLAIACFTDEHWSSLTKLASRPEWTSDPRFVNLESRLVHQDALDAAMAEWTADQDGAELMMALQGAGVPAGVCQTAEDRCDHDPQLAYLEWLTEVTGTKIGTWPVAEVPAKLSESPAYIGGRVNRGAPCYGEDNEYVYGELLGMSTTEIRGLSEEGVI